MSMLARWMNPAGLGAAWLVALAACGDDKVVGDTSGGDTSVASDTSVDLDGDATSAPDGDAVTTTDAADTTDTTLPGAGIAWPGWHDATIYFAMIDRFFDGDPSNNHAYGRQSDGVGEVATFHGGDLAGLKQKVDSGYFLALGVSAIWITAPYEQIHGWVVGGTNKHYAYHGYYPLDFTRVDQAYGSDDDLGAFIDAAHSQGIRVVFDIVMNHAGYATPVDLAAYGVDVLKPGWENATPANLYDFIDFQDPDFANWWGPKWVRAEIGGGYPAPDNSDLKKTVDYLPDFLTESTATNIGLPPFYAHKSDTRAVARAENTVREYLIEWLTDWVRTYGVDGFRCDTAKHVELPAWKELKASADAALVAWREAHPDKRFPDADYPDPAHPFWMTGEVFPHGVVKDEYFSNGFDSIINFDFQNSAPSALDNPAAIDGVYADYASKLNAASGGFQVLSYLSSHDTSVFFERSAGKDLAKQKRAGELLLFAPGGVQIFYGDENGRDYGSVSDANHRTRTDYKWGANPDLLSHWQIVGRFRKAHPAVGGGQHVKRADAPYTFERTLGDDVVFVVMGASGSVSVDVSDQWFDSTVVRDATTGATATVASGKATFTADPSGLVMIERVP
ncbi:MAG: alpha-amylase family glycosyl hydrolase [Myxococcota bacterium]